MAYRRTERTAARLADNRARILDCAHKIVAAGGFRQAQMAAVADAARVATGTLYRYFSSRSQLLAEVFRHAAAHEVQVVGRVVAITPGTAKTRLAAGAHTFASRAIRGRRLAYALIAEPADPAVEAERLIYRRAYADLFQGVIEEAIARGECPEQNADISAACLVGAMAEALVGPLAPDAASMDDDGAALIDHIVGFALRAVFERQGDLT